MQRKRNTKEVFQEALIELLRTKSIEKITVDQIASLSGFSIRTFYNHFDDKYQLMLWIEKNEKSKIHEHARRSGYSFHEYILGVINAYIYLQDYVKNGVAYIHDQQLFSSQRIDGIFEQEIEYLKEKNRLERIPEDILFQMRMHEYAVVGIVEEYIKQPQMSKEELATKIEESLSDKLKPYFL